MRLSPLFLAVVAAGCATAGKRLAWAPVEPARAHVTPELREAAWHRAVLELQSAGYAIRALHPEEGLVDSEAAVAGTTSCTDTVTGKTRECYFSERASVLVSAYGTVLVTIRREVEHTPWFALHEDSRKDVIGRQARLASLIANAPRLPAAWRGRPCAGPE